ncbi:MAG: TonB-dependent receptor [Pseudomonadota bacterium]
MATAALAGLAGLAAFEASAQRAAENVVRAVDDAFGASVGEEQIGLYSPGSVRGFSPTSAGNVRLEGLFIDRQAGFSSRLVASSTIRAGLTAQGYLLPAPTGIADFALRRVADTPTQSAILRLNEYAGYGVAIDLQGRFAEGLVETTGGVGFDRFEISDGTADVFANAGGTLRLQPGDRVDITLFGDYVGVLQEEISPRYFPAGPFAPPRVPRREFVGQPWVGFEGDRYNVGLIGKLEPQLVAIEFGVFRSSFDDNGQAGQFFVDVQPDSTGQRLAFLGPPSDAVSDSLEARVSRQFGGERHRHTLTLNVRARQRERRFGGGVEIDLGEGRVDVANFVPEPDLAFGEVSREQVEQITGGFSYDLRWRGVGQLNLGVQQTDYERVLEDPVNGPVTAEASPLLYNATGAVELRPWLVAYGGVVTGFEESPTAPAISLNRNEAPPAIETRQADGGLRARLGRLTAVAGVFTIEKPFFGLDSNRFFVQRGVVTNRGVELSLAGPITPQLQLVVGTLLLDATLTGDAVDEGQLSSNPIGVVRRSTTLDLDYRPAWARGWSFDVSVFSRGLENGDELDELRIPERTLVDLGFRRQLSLGARTLVVRGRVSNLFDTFGWDVSGNGAFQFQGPRTFTLSLRADF